jgi:DNA polymerase-1
MANYEADDLIATYARIAHEQGAEVVIVSSDKDLMQLVRPGVTMLDPIKYKPIGEAEVREKFGVGPDKVIDVQALAGDSVDNVPGVPGIGVKTAAELITTYGDLDTLLARAGEIKQPKRRENLLANIDKARISRELVTLKHDVPVADGLDTLMRKPADPAILQGFLEAQGFRSVITRLQGEGGLLAGTEGATPAGAASLPAPAIHRAIPAPAAARPAPAPQPSGPPRYELVQDEATLERWIARARTAGAVAIDTETTSVDPMRAELIGISMAVERNEGCYIPLGHCKPGSGAAGMAEGGLQFETGTPRLVEGQLDCAKTLALLKGLLADPAVLKIGHNVKYDMAIFARHGLALTPVDDTMLLSYVLDAGAMPHGLDELASQNLGRKNLSYDAVTGTGKARIPFAEVSLERARDYAAEDAEVALSLHHHLRPRLLAERLMTVYETIERPLIPVLCEMEMAGIAVDPDELRRLSNDFALRLAEIEKKVQKAAKAPFNVGSPTQLGKVLFEDLGLKMPDGSTPKKTKTGAYQTGADVLEGLAAIGHELPRLVLDWRQLSKLKSTYADALVEEINPRTKRVHTSFAMAVASTGRLSSSDPNLQNIPVRTEEGRKIRHAFVAAPGTELVSFDYSQIELRLVAHVADIAQLKQAFKDGVDIHALTASEVFGVPVKGMDPMVRRRAKAINFGIIYGISAFGLANQLSIPQSEARAYIAAYFARYPGIRDYMERTKDEARKQGYVTTVFGRRIHLPAIQSKNAAERSFMERAAINAPIQGGAADIIKRAMVRLPAALAEAQLSARMLLQVHDELLFEVKPKERAKTIEVVKRVMEGADRPAVVLSVPLVVEVGHGHAWDEAH